MNQDEREQYYLYSKLPVFRKRVNKTHAVISDVLGRTKNPYAAISFGKDSVVLMHLLLQHKHDIPMVWSDRGPEAEFDTTYPYIKHIAEKYKINLQVIKPAISMFEIYRRHGLPGIDEGVTRNRIKNINLVHTFDKYIKENNSDAYFQGLRADESAGRKKFAKNFGYVFTRKKDNMLVCNPLLWWSGRSIWAYIVANDIPYHPEYDNDKFKNREYVRLSNWSGLYMARKGRMVELKYYHPELFNKLAKEFPQVNRLV